MWVDAHLHLDAPEFDADCEAVIARAVAAGVGVMVSAGTSVEGRLRCAAVGWMLSLAGPVTFANAGALREVAKRIPIDHLLLETDAPYLAPAPVRGRRCEPSFLVHTARVVAALREIDGDALASRIA